MDNSRGPITACVDHSDDTPGVVRWAAAEAVLRKAELRLVTVVDGTGTTMSSYQLTPEYYAEIRTAAENLLHRCVTIARDTTGGTGGAPSSVHTHIVHGAVREALITESEQSQLLVLGAQHRGAVANVGSVVAALSAHGRCPIALINHLPVHTTASSPKVVVGVDDSSCGMQALSAAFAEADLRGATLMAVHAWRRHHSESAYVTDRDGTTAAHQQGEEAVLGEMVAGHRDQYPDLEVLQVVEEGEPVDVLAAAGHDADLMIVGSRGRGGFSGMLLGSTSSRLLTMATCPVVIVRHNADEAHGPKHALHTVADQI